MLSIEGLDAGYAGKEVLRNVSINVADGEFVTIIGANTAGKSTLLRCISRLIPILSGRITFADSDMALTAAHQVAGLGIGHVPEGRHVFPGVSVQDNLLLGLYPMRGTSDQNQALERIYALFPRLRERRKQLAGTLSGGEQQMVALGRALILRPRLLILDEPSHGLAPKVVDELHQRLCQIHESGVSILLVEQNVALALSVAQRGYVLEQGKIVMADRAAKLANDDRIRVAYLGM